MNVDLTAEERALFDAIQWHTPSEFRDVVTNGERAAMLMERLLEREAIPGVRLRYFTDPEMNAGLKKSRRQVFIDNGTTGRYIYTHPNFLKYLRYFVLGPDLPKSVVEQFKERAAEPFREWGQLREIARTRSRDLIRRVGRRPEGLEEEFFKMAVESGLDVFDAKTIRTDVMNVVSSERRR